MNAHAESAVIADLHDGALWITLNRPESLNAMNKAVRLSLIDQFTTTARRDDVRVVVIRGDSRAFSAGGDMKEMGGGPDSATTMLTESNEIIELIESLPKLVVAAVRGHAAGAGMSLALACDLIVADSSATFTPSFVLRGLAPDMSGTYFLPRQLGLHRAMSMITRGVALDATTAHALGLIGELWEPAEFDERLRERIETLANGPTRAHAGIKRLFRASLGNDLTTQLELEREIQVALTQTADHRESVMAFVERREPVFRGE